MGNGVPLISGEAKGDKQEFTGMSSQRESRLAPHQGGDEDKVLSSSGATF